MKVLLLASLAESLVNFRGALIEALRNAGHEVHVAAPDFLEGDKTRKVLEAYGVIVHEVKMSRTGLNPFCDIRTFAELLCLMLSIKPEVCISYTIKPVIYGSMAAWLAGVPRRFVLITGLGYAFARSERGLRQAIRAIIVRLYRLALRSTHKVFFQNYDDQALFAKLGIVKANFPSVVVRGSGVDTASFEQAPLPTKGFRFLLIARLLGDKGVREYVEAAKKVRLKYSAINFDLAGWIDVNPDAISQRELDHWVAEGHVNFLGKLDDVRPLISSCSVYVLPSYREGMPRTVLEAMSMGRAIITTNAPGCREAVAEGKNGFLVAVRDVGALAEAMCRFIDRPDLAVHMGKSSRQIAVDLFDVHKVNQVLLKEMDLQ